jgi:transposase
MPKALSLDLRQRILKACDAGDCTQGQVAARFEVSRSVIGKLLCRRRRTGQITPGYDRCGRRPLITPAHQRELRRLVHDQNDRTLEELRAALGLDCTIQAIHYALRRMGLSYKKRHSGRANKTGPTSSGHGVPGAGAKPGSTRPA